MKTVFSAIIVSALCLTFAACHTPQVGQGSLYTQATFDQTWIENRFAVPGLVGGGNSGAIGDGLVQKVGQDCKSTFFPLNIFFVNLAPSARKAMTEAGITKIASIDRSHMSILAFLYARECIIVSGQ